MVIQFLFDIFFLTMGFLNLFQYFREEENFQKAVRMTLAVIDFGFFFLFLYLDLRKFL